MCVCVCVSLSSGLSVFPTASVSLQTQRLQQQIPSAPAVSGVQILECVFRIKHHITVSLCVKTVCVLVWQWSGEFSNSPTVCHCLSLCLFVYILLPSFQLFLSRFVSSTKYLNIWSNFLFSNIFGHLKGVWWCSVIFLSSIHPAWFRPKPTMC